MSRVRDRTSWPAELMHDELCAWRFGANAACDCGLTARLANGITCATEPATAGDSELASGLSDVRDTE